MFEEASRESAKASKELEQILAKLKADKVDPNKPVATDSKTIRPMSRIEKPSDTNKDALTKQIEGIIGDIFR